MPKNRRRSDLNKLTFSACGELAAAPQGRRSGDRAASLPDRRKAKIAGFVKLIRSYFWAIILSDL